MKMENTFDGDEPIVLKSNLCWTQATESGWKVTTSSKLKPSKNGEPNNSISVTHPSYRAQRESTHTGGYPSYSLHPSHCALPVEQPHRVHWRATSCMDASPKLSPPLYMCVTSANNNIRCVRELRKAHWPSLSSLYKCELVWYFRRELYLRQWLPPFRVVA